MTNGNVIHGLLFNGLAVYQAESLFSAIAKDDQIVMEKWMSEAKGAGLEVIPHLSYLGADLLEEHVHLWRIDILVEGQSVYNVTVDDRDSNPKEVAA